LPSASLLRTLRLIKLARLLRVIRHHLFQDVLSMVQGLVGGGKTLAWAVILFIIVVYVVALLFREIFGRRQVENVYEMFDTVPRAMYTTFRCSFGDCNTSTGLPIFEYVQQYYGTFYSLIYCLFLFCITIGIFNVISSIFVQSTLHAAASLATEKRQLRLRDPKLWNSRITSLVRSMVEASMHHKVDGDLSEAVEDIYGIDVPTSVIDEIIKDCKVQQLLDDLDIDPDDHRHMSELLDPDNGGTIGVCDVIDGLRRLRGDPKRSDIVSINMMIRSLQVLTSEIHCKIEEFHGALFNDPCVVDTEDFNGALFTDPNETDAQDLNGSVFKNPEQTGQ